jgi:hypothetical protein
MAAMRLPYYDTQVKYRNAGFAARVAGYGIAFEAMDKSIGTVCSQGISVDEISANVADAKLTQLRFQSKIDKKA